MGPETYNDLGNESYLSANRLPKGSGIEHLRDSNITDTGTVVSVNSNTAITGSFTVVTGSVVELQVTNLGVNLGSALTDSHIISGSLRVNPNGLFVSSSGLVGVGTTNPRFYTLHVVNSGSNAQIGVSNQGTADGDRQLRMGFGGNGANTWAELQGTRLNVADDVNIALQPGGGNVGIGTTSPSSSLDVTKNQNAQTLVRITNTTSGTSAMGEFAVYTNSGNAGFGKYSTGTTSYKNITAGSTYVYNGSSGDISLLNDYGPGNISFAAGGSSTAQMFISGSGNIGIGTITPNTLVHINTARSSGANVDIMTLSDNVTGVQTSGFGVRILATSNNGQAKSAIAFEADGGTNNDTAIAFYTQTSAASLDRRMTINKNGFVGIGTTSITGPLTIAVPAEGASIGAANAQQAFDYSRLRIKHYTESNLGLSIGYAGANYTYMQACYNEGTIAPLLINPFGGNIGIGTTTPGSILVIRSGVSNSVASPESQVTITNTTSGNYAALGFRSVDSDGDHGRAGITVSKDSGSITGKMHFVVRESSGTFSNPMTIVSGGSVGIGTSDPKANFHVDGSTATLRVGPWFSTNDRDFIQLQANSTNTSILSPNETFSILNPSGNIDIISSGSGGVRLTPGATSWAAISDIRKKKNFESTQGLAELLQIEPIKYHFEWDNDSTPKRLGFKAQNLQPLIPEMVHPNGEKAEDGSDILTIIPDYILPVLVKAIQELKAENDTLKSRIDTLEQA